MKQRRSQRTREPRRRLDGKAAWIVVGGLVLSLATGVGSCCELFAAAGAGAPTRVAAPGDYQPDRSHRAEGDSEVQRGDADCAHGASSDPAMPVAGLAQVFPVPKPVVTHVPLVFNQAKPAYVYSVPRWHRPSLRPPQLYIRYRRLLLGDYPHSL